MALYKGGTTNIVGFDNAGNPINNTYDNSGHLEVAVHSPILPFGSIHTEKITPIFQTDAVYGINSGQVTTFSTFTGTASADDSIFYCSTGSTIYSQAVILGRKRLRYRAGQGVIGRFTASFSTPVLSSYQIAGFGHAEDGLYVGYKDLDFGILYTNRGAREVRSLTISTGSATTQSVNVTLNSVLYSIAVTNASNVYRTVWELSQGAYSGWDAYPNGNKVTFVRKSAGTASGTYSLSGLTAVGTFAQDKGGAAETQQFVKQSEWNGDKLDGSGSSTVSANWQNLNVFQTGIQYLGAGAVTVEAEIAPVNGNNATFETLHTFRFPGSRTTTTFGNPSFPFTMAAYSAGSTTNLTVKCGSYAGFIEGDKVLHGNRFTYFNQLTTVGASNFHALFTILNTRYYAGKTNQAVINLLSVTGALKHTSPCIYYLIRNGNLVGNPNFQQLSNISCSLWDTAATSVTYSTGDQLVWTGHLGDTGELDHHFGNGSYNAEEITLQPGEWITLAAKSSTGSPSFVTGSCNTREDQ